MRKPFLLIFLWSGLLLIGGNAGSGYASSEKEAALKALEKAAYNFHETSPDVYRSGLLSEEAVPLLKMLGIKTVLNFDDHEPRASAEKERLERLGIDVIRMPWSGFDEPSEEVIAQSVELIQSPKRRPILVHCKHGQERTGVALACWRILHQDWPADRAYQEMKSYGFRPFQYGHLKSYVYAFARKHGKADGAFRENKLEQMKTKMVSSLYRLRHIKLFSKEDRKNH